MIKEHHNAGLRPHASIELTEKDIARFWEKVDKSDPDGCWNWLASTVGARVKYGQFGVRGGKGGTRLAHRVSYVMAFGDIPDEKCVLHRCDNPLCVNPAHFFLGTYKDNSDDKMAKGRDRKNPNKGEKHHNSKLKESDIFRILNTPKEVTSMQLSREMGFHVSTICRVRNREVWTHITTSTSQLTPDSRCMPQN